jgi:flagellin
MALRIQNNVEAFNAHRQLQGTASKAAKAMEKLSSGYRINRAADDAAGLAISEKMRSQIGGLDQAQRNAQDGVSLVQTGEGALNEVHSMLQRIRDLKVQYANGTLDADDKTAISAEVQQLGTEISDITKNTEFNGIKLLSGGGNVVLRSARLRPTRSP